MLFRLAVEGYLFDFSLNAFAARRFSTGGVRLGRARRQWSRSHPFPFPLPGRNIGEGKAKVNNFLRFVAGPIPVNALVD